MAPDFTLSREDIERGHARRMADEKGKNRKMAKRGILLLE
jgi:hypothetical protein